LAEANQDAALVGYGVSISKQAVEDWQKALS
jgi:hypothetical protein